jgi:hypothetical protein
MLLFPASKGTVGVAVGVIELREQVILSVFQWQPDKSSPCCKRKLQHYPESYYILSNFGKIRGRRLAIGQQLAAPQCALKKDRIGKRLLRAAHN